MFEGLVFTLLDHPDSIEFEYTCGYGVSAAFVEGLTKLIISREITRHRRRVKACCDHIVDSSAFGRRHLIPKAYN